MHVFGQSSIGLESPADQFRLVSIQLYNWGTFSGIQCFNLSPRGWLFAGPSGSGKSTVLDGHALLLTPPKWSTYNSAALDSGGRSHDRNALSYVRGAWKQLTTANNETATEYLRTGSTWSVVTETYRNGRGDDISLACVLYIKGDSNVTTDVKRVYLTLERWLDVTELEFFKNHNFDTRRFKVDLPDATMHQEFSAYQERFRTLLQIPSERALRLLHKTQSLKTLDSLDDFLRGFMLDDAEAPKVAQQLVNEFVELDQAHKSVVDARLQRDTLLPARAANDERERLQLRLDEHAEEEAGVEGYVRLLKRQMLNDQREVSRLAAETAEQQAAALKLQVATEEAALGRLRDRQRELGGGDIDRLVAAIADAETTRVQRDKKRNRLIAACKPVGLTLAESLTAYVEQADAARRELETADGRDEQRVALMGKLAGKKEAAEAELAATDAKLEALIRRPDSLIHPDLQAVRDRVVELMGLETDDLPFAGELMEVRKDEAEWRGAIERVLAGFARSLLVHPDHNEGVARYLNETHTGQHVTYYRTLSQVSSTQSVGKDSLVAKLDFKECAQRKWLLEELKSRFDMQCVDDIEHLKRVPKGVTRQGLVKSNQVRHDKNDRRPVHDRSQWVLSFDTAARKAELIFQQTGQREAVAGYAKRLEELRTSGSDKRRRDLALNQLQNTLWEEIDVASAVQNVGKLQTELETLRKANPDVDRIARDISEASEALGKKREEHTKRAAEGLQHRTAEATFLNSINELQSTGEVALTPIQSTRLPERFKKANRSITLETLGRDSLAVQKAISNDKASINDERAELKQQIEACFVAYRSKWLAQCEGLDPTLAAATEFFAKLDRLLKDNLPEFENRFFELLNKQSDQNLVILQRKLQSERAAITVRLDTVNEGLKATSFSSDQTSRLVIDVRDRTIKDVVEFQQAVKHILSHTFSDDREILERRFEALAALVKRLGSQDAADKRWQSSVLDVRNHVEFKARELDEFGKELDAFEGGGGKSGGQRQKLTSTILASALRYQLAGADRVLPIFSTVVLDEAFDKSDPVFTELAINVFQQFGFQMVFATPLKNVSTLEHYIGGGSFVHIVDRKHSRVIPIEYDEAACRFSVSEEMLDVDAEAEHEAAAA